MIRKFKLTNLEGVMKIEKVSFPEKQTHPESLFVNYHKKYPEGFIVAEKEKNIVGYAIGRPQDSLTAQFISLAVNPTCRKRGIGTQLTFSLINHFKRQGMRKIALKVRMCNDNAISFYQNLHFKILKSIKGYYRDGDDAYLMEKEI